MPLRLPRCSFPPLFDASEWGGRFPDRRYYPFYLANGRDAVLINISGSGDGHWEHAPYSADVISKLHATGWYKADRRIHRPDCGVYGPLVCLGEFTACPRLYNDYVIPRSVKQYFDPKTATLTTFYSQLDDRTDDQLDLRIETYLCGRGVIIQEIEVINAPNCGLGYAFSLGSVSPGYQNYMRPTSTPEQCELQSSANGSEITMNARWPGLNARAFSLIGGAEVKQVSRRSLPGLAYEEIEQIIEPLGSGSRFWRAVSFQDDREGDDPVSVCAELLQELKENGIQRLREQHLVEWENYFSTSNVKLPDPAAQYLYDLSRYVIKANHHPQGFQPVGLLPYQWQGAMFWDASHAQEAFVTCGNVSEARAISNQIKRLIPEGKELANRLGNSGSRIEWTNNLETFTHYEPPTRQFHNNAVWARSFCQLTKYLGELPTDEDLEAIKDLLQFLVDEFEQHGNAKGAEFAFVGIDESSDDPKPYDTWTIACLLRALEQYLSICKERGFKPAFSGAIVDKLEKILQANVDEQNVLQSFRGGRLPHWGSLVFEMFPKHPSALPTLSRMTENYDAERDLFNFHGLTRYAEKSFPWATYIAARCMAKIGRPEALSFFLHGLNHINYFGGISERIYYHGEPYIDWFSSAHAGLVLAMNTILATEVEGRVQLLGGIDLKRWTSISFKNLHAGDGWVVSMDLKSGVVKKCVVQNLHRETRPLILEIPPLNIIHNQAAAPGANTILIPA